MSQENVEIVLGLQLGPDVDGAPLVRDDATWSIIANGLVPFIHPDFETESRLLGREARGYGPGIDGFRAFWLDWLAPWESYRIEVERAIDRGDRVLVLVRDFARRAGSTVEVEGRNGSVWTFRDGKVLRFSGYADRTEALEAVGLEE